MNKPVRTGKAEPMGGVRTKTSRIAGALEDLEAAVRRDLDHTNYPTPPWVPPRRRDGGERILDVAIVGAGQGGISTAFGLLRERITNIAVVDRHPEGLEGPWVTFAGTVTLAT